MGTLRKLTMEQCEQAKKMRSDGISYREIGKFLGVNQMSAYRALIRVGGDVPETEFVKRIREKMTVRNGVNPAARVSASGGYFQVRVADDDPMLCMARRNKARRFPYVLEHRLVLARKLGRPLTQEETVHHINGDRQDNRPENLELRVGRHGKGATSAHCKTCTCFAH